MRYVPSELCFKNIHFYQLIKRRYLVLLEYHLIVVLHFNDYATDRIKQFIDYAPGKNINNKSGVLLLVLEYSHVIFQQY